MVKSTEHNRSLILGKLAATPQLPEEQTYQARLRAAAAGSVGEADVTEVVAGIVSRAKEGDRHAIDQFFKHVLGTDRVPTKITNTLVVDSVEQAARVAARTNGRKVLQE